MGASGLVLHVGSHKKAGFSACVPQLVDAAERSLLARLGNSSRPKDRSGVLVIDEYQDVVSSGHGVALGDESFLAKGREANTITIAATPPTAAETTDTATAPANSTPARERRRVPGATTGSVAVMAVS